jgi:hypothetical protein
MINNEDELELDFNLDTKWIDDFDKLDNEYKNYYKEDLSFIKIHSIYINFKNEIEKLVEEKLLLKTPGTIMKQEVLGLIKKNMYSNNNKYKLLSILKFNIDIEPYHLKYFLKYTNTVKKDIINIGNQFLHINKNIDDIHFEKSISMFHDINDLIFIYYYNSPTSINNNNNNENNKINSLCNKNITKKVFINSINNKKTKRKYT